MKLQNLLLKQFYQQHAGFINVELIKRQQNKIISDIKNLSELLENNKIIFNPKIYFFYKKQLDELESKFKLENSKGKKADKKYKKELGIQKNYINQNKDYIDSFKKLNDNEKVNIEYRIKKLKKEKTKNDIKIISEKKNIKNFDQFLRYYSNIEPVLLKNFSEYIVKNIENGSIKNKLDLKEAVLYLKKILNLKMFLPLFTDPKIISIFKDGILDSISDLKKQILDMESSIKNHFKKKISQLSQLPEIDKETLINDLGDKFYEKSKKITKINDFIKEINKYNIELGKIEEILKDLHGVYTKEDILIDLVEEPMKNTLKNIDNEDDLNILIDDYYGSRTVSWLKDKNLNNKEGILKFNQSLNKLKLYTFLNLKNLQGKLRYDTDLKMNFIENTENLTQIYNYIKNRTIDLNLINEIKFMSQFFYKARNAYPWFTNMEYFLEIMNKGSFSKNYSFIDIFDYPLSDEENEIMFQEFVHDNPEYKKLNDLEISNEDVNIRYKIYKKQSLMEYGERKEAFIDKLINIFNNFYSFIIDFEGSNCGINYWEPPCALNYFRHNSYDVYLEYKRLKKIKENINNEMLDIENKISDLKNFKSNLEDRKSALIFESNSIKIYQPRNKNESNHYGKGTAWCTAAQNNNMFCHYHKPEFNNLFIIVPVGKKPTKIECIKTHGNEVIEDHFGNKKVVKAELKYQLDTSPIGDEKYLLMDSCDKEVKICDLVEKYPELKYFLKYIEYYKYNCSDLKNNKFQLLTSYSNPEILTEKRELSIRQREARRRKRQRRRAAKNP